MLGIRLERELEQKLAHLAHQTGKSKSYYAREAIKQFLENQVDEARRQSLLARRMDAKKTEWESDDTGWRE